MFSVRLGLALLLFLAGSAVSQIQNEFWQKSVRTPLNGPDAEVKFIKSYKGSLLPDLIVAYFEGSVISVTGTDSAGRKVLLSISGEAGNSEIAEAALLFDGRDWKLKTEPMKGTRVRFRGIMREFTKQPFLITFEPVQISGLDIETTQRNLPFEDVVPPSYRRSK